KQDETSLRVYLEHHQCAAGWWHNIDKYIVSLLKAYYGDAAKKENDFGFEWLPKLTGDHSHFGYWLDMADGKLDGLFVMGQNPAVGAPNAKLERMALRKLKWLVVRDMVETETATFWRDSPEVMSG
ncbi:MAG: formate dehydrogenase, partial [Acidobacteria bacterium]